MLMNLELCQQTFGKKAQVQCFIKTYPVEAELFFVDGRTDRHDEANSRLSQFYERA